MGTATNIYIDFIDFLTRKMIYDYTKEHLPEVDKAEMDPWKNDFEMCFTNDVRFSFYLSFKTVKEFEQVFGENMKMISEIKSKTDSTIVDQIVVRTSEFVDSGTKEKYRNVNFLDSNQKIQENVFRSILCKLGATFENESNNVGRVICAGNKKFTDSIHTGMQNAKMDIEKLHMV